jgi:hypothetical protein
MRQAPKRKHQITNKHQVPNSKRLVIVILVFGYYLGFVT